MNTTNTEKKHYAKRDPESQGIHYINHVSAMTTEGLHAKSAIAAELAHRDIEIERLRVALASPAQAAAPAQAVRAGWNACLRNLFSMTDQTGDEAAARETTEFMRGRVFEAKGVARAMNSFGPEHCDDLQAYFTPPAAPAQAGEQNHLPLAITSAPERIWLDLGVNPCEEDAHFSNLHDLTWSQDNATGDGIEYVRADLAARGAAQAAPVDAAKDASARFKAQHEFLVWNREQTPPPIESATEYSVFSQAVDLYLAARAAQEGK